jgi:isoleucyl-tRNA synthetase
MDYKFGETGESQNDLLARGQKVIDAILTKYPGKTVAIVSHGFPTRALEEQMGAKTRTGSVENADPRIIYLDNNTGRELNLHRPTIDNIYLPSVKVQNTEDKVQSEGLLKRIPEVLDVWMDSASMPYAQVHYPFENQEKMEASFPADFIAEYTGQIRAWFYVMHAIGVMVK